MSYTMPGTLNDVTTPAGRYSHHLPPEDEETEAGCEACPATACSGINSQACEALGHYTQGYGDQ